MLILVAGSTGLIGSALVPALRTAGHEVRRLVRRTAAADDEYSWDPPAGRIPAAALDGVGAVVNLCGASLQGRWTAARKQELRDSRIEPTEVLAEAVAEHGVPVLANASGIGYYGNTGDVTVDESSGEGAGFLAELCADWEAATEPARSAGARVVFLRSGVVLAGGGGLLGALKPVFWLGLGGRLGDGRQYLPWISLPDEVSAIQFVLEHAEVSGPVNLCAPEPVTNRRFTKAFGRALNRPTPWLVPGFALRALIGDAADELALSGQRAKPAVLSRTGFGFRHTDLDSALAAAL